MAPKLSALSLLVLILSVSLWAQNENNKLWILIENAQVFQCQGVNNEITVDPNNIKIIDSNNNPINLIEAPGEYRISFKDIHIQDKFVNLNGFMRVTLQVPLAAGPFGVNWHYTYQAIPHKKLFDGSQCDNESGVVLDPLDSSKEYCKYCDLCQTSHNAEKLLGSNANLGHKYLPTINSGQENSFDKMCHQVNSGTYDLLRTVSLPDRFELENEANANFKGIDDQLKQRLSVGKGKINVFLILQSNSEPPDDLNRWYAKTQGCECCEKDDNGQSHCQRGIFNRLLSQVSNGVLGRNGNHCPNCNNIYAQDCLRGVSQKISCLTVEFNFRVLNNKNEADKLKSQTSTGSKSSQHAQQNDVNSATISNPNPVSNLESDSVNKEDCLKSITSQTFSTYCRNSWDAKFCCDLPSCKNKC